MATKLDAQVDELRQRYNLDTEGINSILDPLLEQYRNSFTIDLLEKQLRFMESTGQLVTKTTVEAEATKKIDNNIDTENVNATNIDKDKDNIEFPIPLGKDVRLNKKWPYNYQLHMIIESKKNIGVVDGMEFTNYLY